jgi:aryl-alcohol dehydrogenase-like predicted oxidoreductase
VHIWDGITPVEEVMRGLDDLVRQGKVLYVGISDAPAWWVAQANTLAELRGWTQFIGLQLEYSLIERTVERELIPMAKALNLGVLAFSPLAGGFLTGKYHGEGKPDGGRMTADDIGCKVGFRTNRLQHGASRTRLVAPSNGASNPDHRSAEGISTPGQSRQFVSGTPRRTIEIPQRSKPNRTWVPSEYLRQRDGS